MKRLIRRFEQSPPLFYKAVDLDFRVVKTSDLPPRFQPPTERSDYLKYPGAWKRWLQRRKRELPAPLTEVLNEAAEELGVQEEAAFISRVESDTEVDLQALSRTKEEWRGVLVERLKREANRFMAAASAVRKVD